MIDDISGLEELENLEELYLSGNKIRSLKGYYSNVS
jgi:Leucine-rich repeat (LRR) protein